MRSGLCRLHCSSRLAIAAAALLVASATTASAQAARRDSVRGRVTTDSGVAIFGATIAVTMAPTAENFTTSSDSAGNYALVIPNGTGEYVLYIGAIGRRPLRQRLTRSGGDTTFVVNARLAPTATTTLATVQVRATRPRPPRALAGGTGGVDGTDKSFDGVSGSLPPELQGNLDAMAALIPGLNITPGGTSAFGLSSEHNTTQLNGATFPGSSIPREMSTSTRFITSPWDVTKGGFSGVLTSTQIDRGSNISSKRGRLGLDHPMLQASDPVARPYGQTFGSFTGSFGLNGPIQLDRYYYNLGVQASRTTSDASSLTDLDVAALTHAGVAPDSAARLLQILATEQVPLTGVGVRDARLTQNLMLTARVDRQLPVASPSARPTPQTTGTFYFNGTSSEALSLSPLAPPGRTGRRGNETVWLQGMRSAYFGRDGIYINELSSSVNYSHSRGTPYLELPGANVLVASQLPDGTGGLGNLSFGGNSALDHESKQLGWEAINQTGFLLKGNLNFPVQVYLQTRVDGYAQSPGVNGLGSFSFASLADVASNAPSSYSRVLSAPTSTGGQATAAAALGGQWNVKKLRWTGGVRVEGNQFTKIPDGNVAIEQAFGFRTDRAPATLAISPRLGVQYFYKTRSGFSETATGYSRLRFGGPQLRAGVGAFRSVFPTTLLSDARVSTGLDDGMRRLLCVGIEAPAPDWSAFATDPSTVPAQCNTGFSNFADTTRNVVLFDPAYRPPLSWRAALGWTVTIKGMYFTVDGLYSLNRNQASTIDLNFAGTQRFTLPEEGNRPVYVTAADIDASSGTASPVQSRSTSAFGRVSRRVSDLQSTARQLTVYSIPNLPFKWGVYTFSYTLADITGEARGFDGATGTDPRAVESSPGAFTPRHTLGFQFAKGFFRSRFGVTTFLRLMSGTRFTPTVSGDVNGDGYGGDRAYVPDIATVGDTAIGNGLRRLLSSGPAAARECLAGQQLRIAARNSCKGPWSATMTTGLFISPAIPRTGNRARINVALTNPLAGIDQLLHGTDKLRGWGTMRLPDATLYQIRGFDQAQSRYVYQVNPRFGSSNPATSTIRAPFRATMEVSLTLGKNFSEQQLEQRLRIRPSLRNTRAAKDTIRVRFSSNFQDMYGILVRMADSLALSQDQLAQVDARRQVIRAKADTIYDNLAKQLAELPPDYDIKAAVKLQTRADSLIWANNYAEQPFLAALLTKGQIRLLPSPMFALVTDPKYRGRFFGF